MTIIEDAIERQGLKQIWLAEQLNITPKTLKSYIDYKNINQVIKFLKLIELVNIPIMDVIEEMKKNEIL